MDEKIQNNNISINDEEIDEINLILEFEEFHKEDIKLIQNYDSVTIDNLDGREPTIAFGDIKFKGKLQETVGKTMIFKNNDNNESKTENTDHLAFEYYGSTTRKMICRVDP